MTESDYLYLLRDMLVDLGVQVDLFWETADRVGGRCDYDRGWIGVNVEMVCTAKTALMTLAHEAGHWRSYLKHGPEFEKEVAQDRREQLAYLHGWGVLKKQLNVPDSMICKADWRQMHEEVCYGRAENSEPNHRGNDR